MSHLRLNQYRIMWIMVLFDLPTETKKERKTASQFRIKLRKDGFTMFQYSIYIRHCSSKENAEVHIKRTKKNLPPDGHVAIMHITDKQFGMTELYYGKKQKDLPAIPQQLSLF